MSGGESSQTPKVVSTKESLIETKYDDRSQSFQSDKESGEIKLTFNFEDDDQEESQRAGIKDVFNKLFRRKK